jgi:hypothetical protein
MNKERRGICVPFLAALRRKPVQVFENSASKTPDLKAPEPYVLYVKYYQLPHVLYVKYDNKNALKCQLTLYG